MGGRLVYYYSSCSYMETGLVCAFVWGKCGRVELPNYHVYMYVHVHVHVHVPSTWYMYIEQCNESCQNV